MLTPQKTNMLVRYDTETGKNIGEVVRSVALVVLALANAEN